MVFSSAMGWGLISIYGVFAVAIAKTYKEQTKTKEGFLVAGRTLNANEAAFSIAATWIWAPALFVASQKAYQEGYVGLFWFTVPNILTLVLFAYFAQKVRSKYKKAFTLASTMKDMHSPRVQKIYIVSLSALSICAFGVQLLAGGAVVNTLTGIPFWAVTLAMTGIAISYSHNSGIGSSVRTDYLQMIIIGLVAVGLVPYIINKAGWDTFTNGLNGYSGTYTSLFSGDGGLVFFSFGITVTIGLLSGSFGDQAFWQRAYSTKENQVKEAFIKGALIFGVVPLAMSVFGFIGAGAGFVPNDVSMVNVETVLMYLPKWTAVPFLFALLSGLISTLDSCLCSISSIAGEDLTKRKIDSVKNAKQAMRLLCIGGLLVANIPNMQILYLFLFYGTLRASTLIPTLLSIIGLENKKWKPTEAGMFYGILAGLSLGLPIYMIGAFGSITAFKWIGTLLTCFLPGVIALLSSDNGYQKLQGS